MFPSLEDQIEKNLFEVGRRASEFARKQDHKNASRFRKVTRLIIQNHFEEQMDKAVLKVFLFLVAGGVVSAIVIVSLFFYLTK